jgi:subtilisin family serine protease
MEMKRTLLSLLVVLLAIPAVAAGPKKADVRKAKNKIQDSYIVVLEDRVTDVDGTAADLAGLHRGQLKHIYKSTVRGFAVQLNEKQALRLAEDPRVKYIEEDGVMSIDATQSGATWGIDRIDQRDLPLSGTYTYNVNGSGVKAYIVDTGINIAHNEFGGRAINGFDAVDNALPAADCNGHGTHVSGTVGGSTYGVAKGVTLVAVRVLDCAGSGTTAGVIAGVNWVATDHLAGQPAVANMSLGGGVSQTLDDAVAAAIADGVTFGVAAGNDNLDACGGSPSRVASAITVGSTTSTDARSSFSNFGTCVDIFAPGSSITSSWYSSNTATNTISGTSMATPHVAGAAAIYLSAHPTATPAAVQSALKSAATPGRVTSPGAGSPNSLLFVSQTP